MVKGYATLVDERTNVNYRDGISAAVMFVEAVRRVEGEVDVVQMNAQWGRMIKFRTSWPVKTPSDVGLRRYGFRDQPHRSIYS